MSGPDAVLLPPPGADSIPGYDGGWIGEGPGRSPFLRYAERGPTVNWSEELEGLHEESSREHFIDVWTRRAVLACVGPLPERATIADVGCSSGYLLEDLRIAHPEATLIGVDLIASGLRKAHALVPQARLLQGDACELPLRDASLDAALSANLLEHLPDDLAALSELRRVLRPGARAVVVVPAGPDVYDYYDRFLGHERRYGNGELARKGRVAGLEVLRDVHLGSLLYPPFWLVKQRNRRRFSQLDGEALRRRVAGDIAGTGHSRAGALACRLEERLLRAGLRLPFGIRGLTVLRRPVAPG
ncbi:MAG TPA: class I SAM-dependent methyltransferase [Solirubrobacteraceae bacterium]